MNDSERREGWAVAERFPCGRFGMGALRSLVPANGVPIDASACPPLPLAHVRELRAEQHDLRAVIDPDQDHDDRGRGTVGGFQSLLADVEADRESADVE